MILVVDASVIVKCFFPDHAIEEHAEHALIEKGQDNERAARRRGGTFTPVFPKKELR